MFVEFVLNLKCFITVRAGQTGQVLDVVTLLVHLELILGENDPVTPLAREIVDVVWPVLLDVFLQLGPSRALSLADETTILLLGMFEFHVFA